MQINGFFKITLDNGNGNCHIYPPKEGGKALELKDLMAFLDRSGFSSYDGKALQNAINSGEECDVPIGALAGSNVVNEVSEANVSLDRLTATVRIYPGTVGGTKVTIRDVVGDLMLARVKFGIDQEAIADLLKNPVYCQDVVVAKAKPVRHGTDASIEYFFNTNPNLKPALLPDGSVDFHSISVISEVQKGDLLARLTPEDRGEAGTDVYGMQIPPRNVKTARLSFGRNIRVSEDNLECFTEVTGHAELKNGQIFVSDVYEVPADVDNSTGDINYAGSINIKGNIKDGFTVTAEGDIIVEGNVEGALVSAGGNIIIKRGINGMNKGVIDAKGNVITKFCENGKVFAGGYVQSGSCINSEITAKGDVVVSDQKGFIAGGVVKAGGKVEACTIGSQMGANARIELGVDPETKQKFDSAQSTIMTLTAEIHKIQPVVAKYAEVLKAGKALDEKNKTYYVQLLTALKSNQEKLEVANKEYEALRHEMEQSSGSKVIVKKDIYPGVTVSFADVSLTVKEKRSFCALEKKGAEVVFVNL